MQGLLFTIYRYPDGDCSKHGASSTATTGLLVGPGIPPIFDDDGSRPVFKLVTRQIDGADYQHLEPVTAAPHWFAFGGNLGYSSDSRWPNAYPLKIHDRIA